MIMEDLWDCFQRHVVLAAPLYTLARKHHLWCHMVFSSAVPGNPAYHDTFLDEPGNGLLKLACAGCHAHTFERRVFQRMYQLCRESGKLGMKRSRE